MNNDNYLKTFGKIVREKRLQLGLSQEDLANESELDRTFISLLERGKRQPTLKTILKLSSIFKIKPSQLLKKIENKIQ